MGIVYVLRNSLFRTAAFRMAVLQALLFAALIAALLGIVWWSVGVYAERQLRAEVKTEMASLLQAASDGTVDMQINQRAAVMPLGPDYYMLADAAGRRIAGNLSYHPSTPGWHTVPLNGAQGEDGGDADQMHLYAVRLADGRWLVAGSDNRSVVELGEVLSERFIDVGIVAILLVLLIGGLTSWFYLRRVDALGELAERVLEGEQTLVIAGSGRGDEFDRLAARLNHMLERMRVLMEGMRQVSNDIAHDLRTPLTHIRQRLEANLEKNASEAVLRESIEQTLVDMDGLLATFRALLRIASVESRQRHGGFEEFDLSATFDSIVETYLPVAEDRGQQLEACIQPGQRLRGDRALLTQMLANLIENALHHTPPGSRIDLALQATPHALTARISDTGPGIPADARERVLRRFVRLDSSRSTPGCGLGLALVAAVANLHGIRLKLDDARPGLLIELGFPKLS
ncbi:sensor histidine kinase [Dyella tabacisoli]|uniref:sensor histidine kinase n=1 Tax=Dyella tabacisoli TaxID=2282381 RepID=UPI0013B4520B|nr:HAMP domain-containing sensor histidine kinase [Dyella tabacisoli]